MTTVDRGSVRGLTANAPSLDELAGVVCAQVVKIDPAGQVPDTRVRFSAIDGSKNFRASVHQVDLMVRYEQEIHLVDGIKVLRGVFRARLDEPVKSDQTLIGAFSFDSSGTTQSVGNVVNKILKDPDFQGSIREDIAYWLAYEVQQHIEVKSRQARTGPLNM